MLREKVNFAESFWKNRPSGAKARIHFGGLIGTTEVVP
jgi:hypothetical protein